MDIYDKALIASAIVRKLGEKARAGTINAKELNRLAGEYGKIAGICIRDQLLEEFSNGQVSEEDVRRIISPILRKDHKYVSQIAADYQNAQFEKAGVGFRAISPEYNLYRENEIVKEISRRSFENGLD